MLLLTKKTLQNLLDETGHTLALDDFTVIEELDQIATGFSGTTKLERRLLNQPIELSGVLFFPLTVAKSLWYAEVTSQWDLTPVQQDGLLFWLLSVPNDSATLDKFSDPHRANRAVKRLCRRLHCTPEEMNSVYMRCMGSKGAEQETPAKTAREGVPADDSVDYGGMLSALLREYGGTPDQWLYETPLETISALFVSYAEKMFEEAEAGRSDSAADGTAVAPAPSRQLLAMAKFRAKVAEIREAWNGK